MLQPANPQSMRRLLEAARSFSPVVSEVVVGWGQVAGVGWELEGVGWELGVVGWELEGEG